MARATFASIDHYIAAQPEVHRPVLERLRTALRKALPRATEGISYQIPVYKVDGAMVLYFAAFKQHYSIYPATEALIDALRPEIDAHVHNKATLRFDYETPVPTRLITRIAKLRLAESAAHAQAKTKAKPKTQAKPKSKATSKTQAKAKPKSVPRKVAKAKSRAR